MITVLNIIFIGLIFLALFLSLYIISEKNVNFKVRKYIDEKSKKYFEQVSRNSLIKRRKLDFMSNCLFKIGSLIERTNIKKSIFINSATIVLLCFVSFVLCFILARNIFKLLFLSLIISLPGFLIPIFV